MSEELDNLYSTVEQLKETIDVVVPKKRFAMTDFADEIISFIYYLLIKFVETDKVKGIPVSKNFIKNLKGIMKNRTHIHHSYFWQNYWVLATLTFQEKLLGMHTATAIPK